MGSRTMQVIRLIGGISLPFFMLAFISWEDFNLRKTGSRRGNVHEKHQKVKNMHSPQQADAMSSSLRMSRDDSEEILEEIENDFFRQATTREQEAMMMDSVVDAMINHEEYNDNERRNDNNQVDPLLVYNHDLIRHRPRNLSLVFVGDSLTRYQYLSLAYFLRYGRWFDPSTYPNNLVDAHSFHHTYHPDEDWNEFFMQSNRMLQPYELCDCMRKFDNSIALERRYFYDDVLNNKVVYINISGRSTAGYQGLYGRVDSEALFASPFQAGLFQAPDGAKSISNFTTLHGGSWEYFTWADMIENHIGPMKLGPTAVAVLNAGLHPSRFHDSLQAVALKEALETIGIKGVWKTTTFTKDEIMENRVTARSLDKKMCHTLQQSEVKGLCFDISWTAELKPELYYDQLHFGEPVYRILNEDLLSLLGLLPSRYGSRLDHSLVLK